MYDSGAESDDIFAGAGEYRSDELHPEMVSKLNDNEKYFVDSEGMLVLMLRLTVSRR